MSAPPSGAPTEPAAVTWQFEHDPAAAVRSAIMSATRKAATAGVDGRPVLAMARTATALEMLADAVADEDLVNESVQASGEALAVLAGLPSAGLDDIAVKLAALLRDSIPNDLTVGEISVGDGVRLAVLAGALADAVLLAGGRLELPERAAAPIKTPEAVAHWRRVAAELHEGSRA
jgi:hypothetical protein